MIRKLLLTAAIGALSSSPAFAEAGDWLVRGRIINVAPNDDAGPVMPAFPAGSVRVDAATVPELDFTYFVSDNWAAELILGTSPHDIKGIGALDGLGKVGEAWALPPTLTLQYHFMPDASVRPYAGVGVNYTIFYSEDTSDSLKNAIGDTKLELDSSFGLAAQVGVDFDINETWFMNVDVKYISMETTATLNTGGSINTVDVDLNPTVWGIGFGRKF